MENGEKEITTHHHLVRTKVQDAANSELAKYYKSLVLGMSSEIFENKKNIQIFLQNPRRLLSTMKTIACTTTLMVIAILAAGVSCAPVYEERRLTLTDARPQSCPTIIDASKFWGTCCSLSSTMSGGGCVLSVANGWCKVRWGVYDERCQHNTIDCSVFGKYL